MPAAALLGMGGLGAALHVAGSVLIVFGQASVKVAHALVDSTGAPSTWVVPRGHPNPPLWCAEEGTRGSAVLGRILSRHPSPPHRHAHVCCCMQAAT